MRKIIGEAEVRSNLKQVPKAPRGPNRKAYYQWYRAQLRHERSHILRIVKHCYKQRTDAAAVRHLARYAGCGEPEASRVITTTMEVCLVNGLKRGDFIKEVMHKLGC